LRVNNNPAPYANGTYLRGIPTNTFSEGSDAVFRGNFSVTPVPFEFSPVAGLSVLGGLWVGTRLVRKARASQKSI
jgi:hypothetical protein